MAARAGHIPLSPGERLTAREIMLRQHLREIRRTVVWADEGLVTPNEAWSKVLALTIRGLGES